MPGNLLQPNIEQATTDQINQYQQIVSSINYIVIIIRLDIAKAIAKLVEFLFNPLEYYYKVAI
jgi:H2-forming N5,N10-methylenetetrahydromethanopterin dehydrogenase-like enzyme